MQKKLLPFFFIVLFTFITLRSFTQRQDVAAQLKQYATKHQQELSILPKDIESLFVTYQYTDAATGIQHIYSTQKLNGLTITNTSFSLHTAGTQQMHASRLLSLAAYKVAPVAVSVGSQAAVAALMSSVNYTESKKVEVKQAATGEEKYTVYRRNASPVWDIPCRLVYYNSAHLKSLIPAWEVQMMDVYKRHYWLAYIDAATGKVLEKKDLMMHCNFDGAPTDTNASAAMYNVSNASLLKEESGTNIQSLQSLPGNKYRVYNIPFESPIDPGAKQNLIQKGGDTMASPDGWHKVAGLAAYNYTHGNNVWAFQDPSPGPLGGVPSAEPTRTAYPTNTIGGVYPVTEPFVFDYPINLTAEPETYQNGAIVNLFFWNNLMHDVFYYMGFNEAAGNFQESNIFSTGRKGTDTSLANDAVLAQAQDGGGTNNANFLALPDGINGQMQMYLWTASSPDSLVQIASSTSGIPISGKKFFAVQGSLSTLPTANNNLYTMPVENMQIAIAQKNALSTTGGATEGCSSGQMSIALPLGNVSGKIALIDRGSCSFAEKILGAQLGGAVGVIVINNVDGPPQAMGGSDAPGNAITIPSVMISKGDGDLLKAQLTAGATIVGSLKRNSPPPPKRDGDIDNGVISHEYGHGISNRLTGGPFALTPLGGDEQGGEGWSDFVALYMTLRNNDLQPATAAHPNGLLPNRSIGNYVTYQNYDGRGIREYPYSSDLTINPATFGYIKRPDYSETHSVGFVWCSMLYEVLQSFIDEYGMKDNVYEGANPTLSHNPPPPAKGNNIATRLVIEAMKLQPASPTFIEERDAILKADTLLYNAQHSCMIWKAFAKRGLGFSALSGTNALGDEVEAFDLPYACDPTQKRISIVKSGPGTVKTTQNVTYTIKLKNLLPKVVTNVKVTDTLAGRLNFVSATGAPVRNGKILTWTTNIPANATKVFTVTAKVTSGPAATLTFADNQESTSANWTTDNSATAKWTYKTDSLQAYSGKHYWFVEDYDIGGSNTSLQSKNAIPIAAGAELVFIHKYASENGYDGGVVEVSTDGTTWAYLPPSKFVQGNYSGIIPTANNPLIGLTDEAAFTGSSAGYTTSIARLDDYTGQQVYIRFRMTADPTGGSVAGGGWWLDDVYVMTNRTELSNTATAVTTPGAAITINEGTNAYSTTIALITSNTAGAILQAMPVAKTVQLQWQTTGIAAGTAFEIERKTAAEVAFKTIGNYTPLQKEGSKGSYQYVDSKVADGACEYRVKITSGNEISYTNVAMAKIGSTQFTAQLYPNPASDIAHIAVMKPVAGNAFITIFDVHGKRLATLNGGLVTGRRVFDIPVQQLASGTYWVEVKTTTESATVPLIIKK